MKMISVTAVVLTVASFAFAAELPKRFHRCSVKSTNFNECVREGVESAIRLLKDGAPELGVMPFEPLQISELVIGQGTGPVNVQQNFKNVRLHGLTGSKVLQEIVDLPGNALYARSVTPELRLEADYKMKGRILLLPIFGSGPCNVTLVNTKINHTLTGESFTRRGKKFLRITNYKTTLRPERVSFNFVNLFDGDERLGTEINKVLNENWDAVFTDVREGYEKSFGLIFQDLANRVFGKVALRDIFLDYEE